MRRPPAPPALRGPKTKPLPAQPAPARPVVLSLEPPTQVALLTPRATSSTWVASAATDLAPRTLRQNRRQGCPRVARPRTQLYPHRFLEDKIPITNCRVPQETPLDCAATSTCAESHRLCTLTPRPPRRPTPRSACWHHRLPGPQPKRAKSPERTPALSGISPAPAVRGNALEPPSADSPAWARARSRPAFLPDPLTSIPSPPAQAPDAASEPQVSSGDTGMGILWPRALTGHPAA